VSRSADSSAQARLRLPAPRLAVLVGVAFTSTSAILIRLSDAPPLAIAAFRMIFSALLMTPAMLVSLRGAGSHDRAPGRPGRRELLWCLASGLFLALHFATWITSLSYTTVAAATVLVNTHPIFIVAASAIFFKERLRPLSLVFVLAAVGGSAILAIVPGRSAGGSLLGNGLALFGAAAVSGYLLIGRMLRPRLGVTQYTFLVYSSAAAILTLVCLLSGTPLGGFPAVNFLIFAGLAIFPTLLGHSVFNWALRYVPPTFISIAVLGEPVLATIFALFLFAEVPPASTLAGGAIVIAAIGAYLFYEGRYDRPRGRGMPVRSVD